MIDERFRYRDLSPVNPIHGVVLIYTGSARFAAGTSVVKSFGLLSLLLLLYVYTIVETLTTPLNPLSR